MGLVMQEPLLFNYTVKENILYGNPSSDNQTIRQAADISNSRVFIESEELENAVEDDVTSLFDAMRSEKWKQQLLDRLTETAFKDDTWKSELSKEKVDKCLND